VIRRLGLYRAPAASHAEPRQSADLVPAGLVVVARRIDRGFHPRSRRERLVPALRRRAAGGPSHHRNRRAPDRVPTGTPQSRPRWRERLQLIAEIAQPFQPIVNIEQSGLTRHAFLRTPAGEANQTTSDSARLLELSKFIAPWKEGPRRSAYGAAISTANDPQIPRMQPGAAGLRSTIATAGATTPASSRRGGRLIVKVCAPQRTAAQRVRRPPIATCNPDAPRGTHQVYAS
jgi:hypothetical protein